MIKGKQKANSVSVLQGNSLLNNPFSNDLVLFYFNYPKDLLFGWFGFSSFFWGFFAFGLGLFRIGWSSWLGAQKKKKNEIKLLNVVLIWSSSSNHISKFGEFIENLSIAIVSYCKKRSMEIVNGQESSWQVKLSYVIGFKGSTTWCTCDDFNEEHS